MDQVEASQPSFGALLRRYRRVAGLTQEALADRAQVSLRGINDLERGERLHPRAETIDLLATALGLEPSQRAALHDAATMRSPPEPPAPVERPVTQGRHHHLPVPISSFIGREQELAELDRLLGPPGGRRLVTLTGAGGCGKSRLALRVASDLSDAFVDGAHLVELALLDDPWLVPRAVATVFDLPETSSESLEATLVRFLGHRELLLVLDNCEHLVEACARLADAFLRSCPRVVILATSREPLRLAGELVWRVPSLALPPVDAAVIEPEPGGFDAIHLFVERARDAQRDFRLTPENAASVVSICRQLDGIPLAIELAGARLLTMSLSQIAARLTDRFEVLTGGSRTAPPRHQTLRKAIDWSYDLLDPAERALFQRLSVFAGGFELEMVEQVCAEEGVGDGTEGPDTQHLVPHSPSYSPCRGERSPGTPSVIDLIQRLVEKSLVTTQPGPGAQYRLLDTLQQYAWERLVAGGEAEEQARRHAAAYLALAEEAATELHRRDQVNWLERLDRERPNLRAALAWLTARDRSADALRLATALGWFWTVRGYYAEGREGLTDALARVATPDPVVRARALNALTYLVIRQSDPPAERHYLEECVNAANQTNDRTVIVEALALAGMLQRHDAPELAKHKLEEALALAQAADLRGSAGPILIELGLVTTFQGDLAGGEARLAEGLALLREAEDLTRLAFGLNLGCMLGDLRGDYRQVRARAEEYRPLVQALGDRSGQANWRAHLAEATRWEGDLAEAEALLAEALLIYQDLDDRYGIAWTTIDLASTHLALGNVEPARALAAKGRELAGAMNLHLVLRALRTVGDVALARGEVQVAAEHYRQGLVQAADHWAGVLRVGLVEGLGRIAAGHQRYPRALLLLGAAAAERTRLGAPPSRLEGAWLERALVPARRFLGQTMADAAYAAGQVTAIRMATAYALDDKLD
jgi:non-specific serine/threonine protein kinase